MNIFVHVTSSIMLKIGMLINNSIHQNADHVDETNMLRNIAGQQLKFPWCV